MKNLFKNSIVFACVLALTTSLVFSSCSDDDKGRVLTLSVTCNKPEQVGYLTFDTKYVLTLLESDDLIGREKNVESGWTFDVPCPEDAINLELFTTPKLTAEAIAAKVTISQVPFTVAILENGKVLKDDTSFGYVSYGIY